MAQFRNITEETLFVATDTGLVKVEADSILTVSDEFAASVYFQVGEQGETALFAPVAAAAPGGKGKSNNNNQPPAE